MTINEMKEKTKKTIIELEKEIATLKAELSSGALSDTEAGEKHHELGNLLFALSLHKEALENL